MGGTKLPRTEHFLLLPNNAVVCFHLAQKETEVQGRYRLSQGRRKESEGKIHFNTHASATGPCADPAGCTSDLAIASTANLLVVFSYDLPYY